MTTNHIKAKKGHHAQRDISVSETHVYSGPLPPPEILEGYEKIAPGSSRIILEEFRKQGEHRRKCEQRMIFGYVWIMPFLSLLLVLFVVTAGVYLIMHNKDATGITTLLAPIGVIVGYFIIRKSKKHQ